MNCAVRCFALTVALAAVAAKGDPWLDGRAAIKAPLAVELRVQAFPLEDVRLLDGPFRREMELDENYLLSLDADRLLRNFRANAGLPTDARPLGGWEATNCELRGHFTGHYLSACAQMYASTGEAPLIFRVNYMVGVLAACQDKLGGGYLSAFPQNFIDRVEAGQRVWAPYYTLHKILAGLEDARVYCRNAQALTVAKKFGDWVIARNSKLTDAQMQAMLGTEQGGMNEALANLYALTGERKYLDISLRFNHHRVLDPAAEQQDELTGLHANTQIPKFIGAARQYELTGDDSLRRAATFFWSTVVANRSYVIGGDSDGEMFTATNRLSQMGPHTTETCNTYNMLKLTRHLFCLEPRAAYGDYYERALYNHILASQNPETGMMCYYVPLRSGSRKEFCTPEKSFWCCTGTGVENHAKYADSIYFHDDSGLYVNLFIPSVLHWKSKAVSIRQETRFPDDRAVKLVFTCRRPARLSVHLRRPAWAGDGFGVSVNGGAFTDGSTPPSGYVVIDREWKTGDTIDLFLPMRLWTESFRDDPNRFAFLRGPLVLAAPLASAQAGEVVLPGSGVLADALNPAPNSVNTFVGTSDVIRFPGQAADAATILEPFYKIYRERHQVYWDLR